jgi:hypothetical protein
MTIVRPSCRPWELALLGPPYIIVAGAQYRRAAFFPSQTLINIYRTLLNI